VIADGSRPTASRTSSTRPPTIAATRTSRAGIVTGGRAGTERLPYLGHLLRRDLRDEHHLAEGRLGQGAPERVHDRGVTDVVEVLDRTDPVNPHDVRLVLDGSRPQQRPPVLAAGLRPVRHDDVESVSPATAQNSSAKRRS